MEFINFNGQLVLEKMSLIKKKQLLLKKWLTDQSLTVYSGWWS